MVALHHVIHKSINKPDLTFLYIVIHTYNSLIMQFFLPNSIHSYFLVILMMICTEQNFMGNDLKYLMRYLLSKLIIIRNFFIE